MLRPLRSPHLARRLLNLCLLLMLLSAAVPAQASAVSLNAPRQQTQQSVPQTLNFVNNVAQVQSTATLNQNQVYLFFGTQNQSLRIQLSSTPAGANFELSGGNNSVYKSFGDPTLDWSFTLPASQNYRITVNSSNPVVFTLVVTLGAAGTAQRITFAPGQTNWQGTGTASPSQSPQFVLTGSAGQTLRVALFSSDGQANFSVRGVTDNQVYKQPFDPNRDWTFTLPSNQDYLITVTSPTVSNFTLQVFLSGAQPGQPERINFAPGQSNATVSGSLQPNVPKTYVFYAASGRTIRLLLTAQPPGGANFSVIGAADGVIYKAADSQREWSYPITVSQDYVVTVFSSVPANYTLEVTVPTALPPTPTSTPGTPVPTIPAGCTNDTIQNGSFEVDGFWIFGDTPIPPAYNSAVTRTPLRSVRLGLDPALGAGMQNAKGFSSVRQPFQISAAATIAQLRWWNFYRTEESQTDNPGLAEDKQQVVLLNPDLTTVAVLRSVRRNTNAWQEEMVDLTPYRGRPLLLYFNVYNDGNGLRTWQYLDDVVIYVCYPAVTPTPVVPTPMPTIPILTLPAPMPFATSFAAPTAFLGTAASSGEVPTAALTLAATIIPPVVGQTTGEVSSAVASTLLTAGVSMSSSVALVTPSPVNGEPVIVELPPAQQGVQVAAAPVQAPPTATFAPLPTQQPAFQPTPRAVTLRAFDRPLSDVLTWSGIMLGALAIIGILVALIWQAANGRRP